MKQRPDSPVTGAEIDVPSLVAARFSARYLNVTHATRALAHLAGAKRSRRRGRGVEFDEVRQYAAGDDVRSIDWRVTARSGEPHTKLFHEERERPVLVTVDLRKPMQFGSKCCFKSVLAAHTASLILWSALDRGERVGGMVTAGEEVKDVKPQRSRRAVLRMIGHMHDQSKLKVGSRELSLAEQVEQLRRIARPGASVFMISDFHDGLDPEAIRALRNLVKTIQLTAIVINDPLEWQLPRAGSYVVSDEMGRSTLNTGDKALRDSYQSEFDAQRAQLSAALKGLRIPLVPLITAASPLPVLQRFFPSR